MRFYCLFVLAMLLFMAAPPQILARQRVRHDIPPQQYNRWRLNYLCPIKDARYPGYGRRSRDGETVIFQIQPGGIWYRYPIEQCRKI